MINTVIAILAITLLLAFFVAPLFEIYFQQINDLRFRHRFLLSLLPSSILVGVIRILLDI